jgi:glycosyltransferase involved in cell wall biosynthesis
VGESDLLIVTSRELRETFGKDAEIIPNAADFDFFHNAPGGTGGSACLATDPIVGYYGAIAEWFDLDLMAEVAASRPQYSFVVIGEVTLDRIGKLKNLPNVHLLGEKPYRELPGYLRQFAVCTLPFRMNRLTRAVDPVKPSAKSECRSHPRTPGPLAWKRWTVPSGRDLRWFRFSS